MEIIQKQTDTQLKYNSEDSADVLTDFSFYKLFNVSDRQMWRMTDVPWDKIDKTAVSKALLDMIRELAYSELTTYSATFEFMKMFAQDLDFTQWLSVWFYEESKHPLVLMRWLSHFGDKFDSQFVRKGREIHPMRQDPLETLCLNIVSEVTAGQAYKAFADAVNEPALKVIMHLLSVDETRHATGFYAYARLLIERAEDKASAQLAALRVLFYCLYSMEQRHPVNEVMKRIQGDLENATAQVGLDDPIVPKIILHKFSQLTGLSLGGRDEIISHIQNLRAQVERRERKEIHDPLQT